MAPLFGFLINLLILAPLFLAMLICGMFGAVPLVWWPRT